MRLGPDTPLLDSLGNGGGGELMQADPARAGRTFETGAGRSEDGFEYREREVPCSCTVIEHATLLHSRAKRSFADLRSQTEFGNED